MWPKGRDTMPLLCASFSTGETMAHSRVPSLNPSVGRGGHCHVEAGLLGGNGLGTPDGYIPR